MLIPFRHLTAKEDYAKFYDLDSSEEEEEEEQRVRQLKKKKVIPRKNSDDSSDEEDSDSDEDDAGRTNGGGGDEGVEDDEKADRVAELGPEIVAKLRDDSVDYARGGKKPLLLSSPHLCNSSGTF